MTRNFLAVVALIAACSSDCPLQAKELVLADQGESSYVIVLAEDASPSTKYGAEELQKFLEKMTGAKIPIVSDAARQIAQEIILGQNAHLKSLKTAIDFPALGDEGYVLRTVDDSLVIAGGALRGNLYGVYGFLEDHLGCRWFAPGVSRIPKTPRLALNAIDDLQKPVLEFRSAYTFEGFDGDWCARNRMNTAGARLEKKHGGNRGIRSLCHTFERLMPIEKHYDAHPEYFALVNGERRKANPQLCCTNPDVARLCTEALLEEMRAHPDMSVFSVSQNDWDNHCECENCQALAEREESQMAPVLQLVNRVAEGIEKEFPKNTVQTLAYQWTRKPPKTIRPRPNVVVMLCSIECCFMHPLATCDSEANRKFAADLEAWAQVAPRLWVWDYVTDFANYLLPFPNQRVRGPNIRFFIDHNVRGIKEQDTYDTADSELAALGAYMTAKLLWNPDYDPDHAMDEFLEGYYGAASAPIRVYLDMLHDHVERENIHVNIWAKPDSAHLNDELLAKADALWQQAEDNVADNPEVLDRVKRSRMSVDFAILERARLQAQGKSPANEAFMKLAAARFKPFCNTLDKSSLSKIREYTNVDKAAYRADLAKDLGL